MEKKLYKLNDRVIMKKPHACQTNEWIITRVGVDIKLRCVNCGREILMERPMFEHKLKKILGDNNETME